MKICQAVDPLGSYKLEETRQSKQFKTNTKYKHISKEDFVLVQTFILDGVPERVALKMKEEAEICSQFNIKNLLHIHWSQIEKKGDKTQYSIHSKYTTAKPLKLIIANNSYFSQKRDPIDLMLQLANNLLLLHNKNLIHGDLTLSNVFYKKSQNYMVMGRPRLRQVDKWLRPLMASQDSMSIAPEISSGETFSTFSDAWQLGVIFLQMILGVSLQQKTSNNRQEVMKQIATVKSEFFQDLLKHMLQQRPWKRMTIIEAVDQLEKIKNNKFTTLHNQRAQIRYYRGFAFSPFLPITKQVSQKLVTEDGLEEKIEAWKFWFNFKTYQTAFLTTQNIKAIFKPLEIQLDFKISVAKVFESTSHPKGFQTRWAKDGSLNIYFEVDVKDPEKSRKIKMDTFISQQDQQQWLVTNQWTNYYRGRLRTNQQRITCLFLAQGLILSVINQETGHDVNSFKFFDTRNNSLRPKNLNFPPEYLQDSSNLHSSYCVIQVERSQNSCPRFKRLVKNYNQQQMYAIAKSNRLHFNYQLGRSYYKRGQIKFNQENHTFQVPHHPQLFPGQPLVINFSNLNIAFVGLYIGKGRGITFDNKFYQRIFQWVASLDAYNVTSVADFTFTILQCSEYTLERCQMPSLGNLARYNLIRGNVQKRKDIMAGIEQLSSTQQLSLDQYIELATLYYDSRLIHYKVLNLKLGREVCEKAQKMMDELFKLPVCSLLISFNLGSELIDEIISRSNGNINKQQCEHPFILMLKCIDILERTKMHPIMLAHSYFRAAIYLNEGSNSVELYLASIRICRQYSHRALLKENLSRMIQRHSVPISKIQKILTENRDVLFSRLDDNTSEGKIIFLSEKIEILRECNSYMMVNRSIRQLMELVQKQFPDDKDKEKFVKNIWTTYFVEIAQKNISIEAFLDFQKIISSLAEDEYVHLKDAFRKKEAIIKDKEKRNMSNIMALMGRNNNNNS